ncbi:hypothetical protein N7497_003927 [Penicillium chrysogenum]|nr:hypothetical protein N7497_003927 [Penicillium chrysogenum]
MSTAIGDPTEHEATNQSFAFSTTLNLNGDAMRSLQELYDFIEKGEFWRMHKVNLKSFRNSWQVTRNVVKVQEGLDRFKANEATRYYERLVRSLVKDYYIPSSKLLSITLLCIENLDVVVAFASMLESYKLISTLR